MGSQDRAEQQGGINQEVVLLDACEGDLTTPPRGRRERVVGAGPPLTSPSTLLRWG